MSEPNARHEGWEALFWSVFERSHNAMWLLDEHRVYVEVNSTFCQIIGIPRSELVGTEYGRHMAEPDRESLIDEWPSLWARGDWGSMRTLVRPDSTSLRVEIAARVGEVGGRPIMLGVCLRATPESLAPSSDAGELTQRENEVVGLIALGLTSSEIAERLVISTDTVRTHVSNAMAKTGARTRAQLVAMTMTTGELDVIDRLWPAKT